MPTPAASANVLSEEFTQSVAVLAHRDAAAAGLRDLARTRSAQVAYEPITIYDLSGEPLFRDYAIQGADGVDGTIRTAANRALGSPLISISAGSPGWDPGRALRMATEALHARSPKGTVTSSRLVCYAYPKIGIELTYAEGRKSSTAIFDASSGAAVAAVSKESHQFTSYSLLKSLKPEAATRVKDFRRAETQIAKVINDPIFRASNVRQAFVKLSPYCPGSPIGLTHYAQITDYFCVDASAQMLLEHYGWNYTQNQIAVAMGTTAAQGGTSGTGLTTGFKNLTDNTLLLTFDDSATRAQQFVDAVHEVNANRPLFTQVPHHYRVCVGYSETVSAFFSVISSQMLYIYDPWPWNPDLCMPGAAYWETWTSSPVMWFGIVHHA